jgi:hypothetical protein
MRVHEHRAGEPARTHEVEPEARLREVVAVEAEERVYSVDGMEELDLELTVIEAFGEEPGHVVVHCCRSITVVVAYTGNERTLQAHPSTRLREVRRQAAEAFGIPAADAAGLQLRLPGSAVDLNVAEPVGAVTPRGECTVTLDLVHAQRPQG